MKYNIGDKVYAKVYKGYVTRKVSFVKGKGIPTVFEVIGYKLQFGTINYILRAVNSNYYTFIVNKNIMKMYNVPIQYKGETAFSILEECLGSLYKTKCMICANYNSLLMQRIK